MSKNSTAVRRPNEVKPSNSSAEQLRTLVVRLQTTLEEERTRIARQVHDELSQKLAVVALELGSLEHSLNHLKEGTILSSIREKVQSLSRLLEDVIQSAQRLTAELRPKVLDELGLVAALEWQSRQFQRRNGIRCELSTPSNDVKLDRDTATELFRITQDILSNVAQHANALSVGISVEERAGHLRLEIKDNGKGITEQQINDPESLGLLAMRERAEHLGGVFRISGRPGKGTTVVVEIPLKPKSPDQ